DRRDADSLQELYAFLVLYKEMGNHSEHTTEQATVPFEKGLIFPEYSRNDVQGNIFFIQLAEIEIPVIVLGKKNEFGIDEFDETASVGRRIGREIENVFGKRIVFPDLVARRGEKGNQYKSFGIVLMILLNNGAPLFKLSERGEMKPGMFF